MYLGRKPGRWMPCLIAGLPLTYMIYKAHYDIVDRRTIIDTRLPKDFHDFRIFFITDIHRRRIKKSTLNSITERIDAVIIGGDMIEEWVSLGRAELNIQLLKKWNAPIYFIWGNNDYKANPDGLLALLIQENITILSDTYIHIRKNDSILSIFGVDYDAQNPERIRLPRRGASNYYQVVVAHSPFDFEKLPEADRNNIHTFLAGHTHGGQVRLFGYGLYKRGGYELDGSTHKLVSEGYGYRLIPVRLGTNAECHVLTFKNS